MVWNVQQRPPASIAVESRPTRLPRAGRQPRAGPPTAPSSERPGLKPGMFLACAPSFVEAGLNPATFRATTKPLTVPRRTLADSLLASCSRKVYTKPDVYASSFPDATSPPSATRRRRPPRPAAPWWPSPSRRSNPTADFPVSPRPETGPTTPRGASRVFLEKNSYTRETAPLQPPAAALIHSFVSVAGCLSGGLR